MTTTDIETCRRDLTNFIDYQLRNLPVGVVYVIYKTIEKDLETLYYKAIQEEANALYKEQNKSLKESLQEENQNIKKDK